MSEEVEEVKKEEPKEPIEIKMTATLNPDGGMIVSFPFLGNKIVTYGFLKQIEKTIDVHYNQKPKIIQPKGGIMDFVRTKH